MKPFSSRFITCEGGEGSGKTTLIRKLERELMGRGLSVMTTREPGGSPLSEQIRQRLLNHDSSVPIGSKAELMLFLAARAQHIEERIQPALSAGQIVLCDRYNDSTIAYQGYARGLGVDLVQQLCDLVCGGVVPGLTFFLDVDPEEGLKRAKLLAEANNGQLDRIEMEKRVFHQRVRQGLQELAKRHPERICTIDASKPAEAVFTLARTRLIEFLEN